MKKLFIVTSLILAGFIGTRAQETYVGAQYQSTDTSFNNLHIFTGDRTNTYGANASLTGYFAGDLGVTGEVAGTIGKNVRNYSVLGGLTLKSHTNGSFRPFVHALAGFAGERVNTELGNSITDNIAPAFVLGGGVDYNTGKRVNIRLFQADYMQTRLFNQTQNTFRLGTGIVF